MRRCRGGATLAGWSALGLLAAFAVPRPAQGQTPPSPCIVANAECTEWVAVKGQPQRLLVYRSQPLDRRNEHVVGALVMVHGGLRLAADQFTNELAAAFLAGALSDTLLIAPRFASNTSAACMDSLAAEEANWICEDARPDSWRNGSFAIGNAELTSFDFADELVRRVADRNLFPNLKHIVIAGHSGGGQYTLRYAMASRVHDTVGVPISYVVSNPDALVYLDEQRPTAAAYPPAAAGPRFLPPASTEAFAPFVDARNCTTFDDWQYGLRNRTGYTAALSDEQATASVATGDLPARRRRHRPFWRLRRFVPRARARADSAGSRPGVCEILERTARRATWNGRRGGLRARRSVHVHGEAGAAASVSASVNLRKECADTAAVALGSVVRRFLVFRRQGRWRLCSVEPTQ
jgi:hypothetical protein